MNVLGVDLGTTNTSAHLIQNRGEPVPLAIGPRENPHVMRSAALRLHNGTWIAGDAALDHVRRNPSDYPRLLTAFKPLLMHPERGRTRWHAARTEAVHRIDARDGGPTTEGGEEVYLLQTEALTPVAAPPGVTSADVRQATVEMLKALASKLQGTYGRLSLDRLVLGVPVKFPEYAKARVIEAAVASGLIQSPNQIALFPEPVAVALAYGIEKRTPARVLVVDHGGGTLDLTVVDIEGRPDATFRYRVLSQEMHDRAGRYYDRLVLAKILEAKGEEGADALRSLGLTDPMHLTQPYLLDQAEYVKRAVYGPRGSGHVRFNSRFGERMLTYDVDRGLVEDAIKPELVTFREKLEAVIAGAHERAGNKLGPGPVGIDVVLLAGGSAQLPIVAEVVRAVVGAKVPIHADYAGGRTTTQGFARAAQYRNLIEELVDTAYSVWSPSDGALVPILKMGTPIRETGVSHQHGRTDGFYFETMSSAPVTAALFAPVHEQPHNIAQFQVHPPGPDVTIQAMVTIDAETGRPDLVAINAETGEPCRVQRLEVGEAGALPVLYPGQILTYRGSTMPNHPTDGTGCLERIERIRDGRRRLPVAVGDLKEYRLFLHHPQGDQLYARISADGVRVLETGLPRPGESVRLADLDPHRMVPLPGGTAVGFQRVPRPATMQNSSEVEFFAGASTGTDGVAPVQPEKDVPPTKRRVNLVERLRGRQPEE